MSKSILYDGIGANKTHKYNRKEFLKMMKKTLKRPKYTCDIDKYITYSCEQEK